MLQNHFEILENPVRFLGHGPEHAVAGLRINRNDARHKYEITGPRRAALRPAVLCRHVEPGGGWWDDVAGKRHVFFSFRLLEPRRRLRGHSAASEAGGRRPGRRWR